jgi:hypothetical protein
MLLDVAAGSGRVYGTVNQARNRSLLVDVIGPEYLGDAVDFWRSRAFSQLKTSRTGVRNLSRPGSSCVLVSGGGRRRSDASPAR